MPKPTTFAVYAGIFIFITTIITIGYQPETKGDVANIAMTSTTPSSTPVDKSSIDQLTATHLASTVAATTNLPIAANVASLSISLDAKSQLDQTDAASTITKPQIVQPTATTHQASTYTTKDGDTVPSVAAKYNISAQTVKWANNLTTDSLAVGTQLTIPPVDGVMHIVKDGDTADSLAQKYQSDAKRIVSLNDLELTGIVKGQKIILPNGVLPTEEQPGYIAPAPTLVYVNPVAKTWSPVDTYATVSPGAGMSGGNSYAFGNCTSWAYERRLQLGRPIGGAWGNATTWDIYARSAGFIVNRTPAVGAVYQMKAFVDAYTGGYGHVGIVEGVNADGSVYVSDMNYSGNFNRVTYRTISASQAAQYTYIH